LLCASEKITLNPNFCAFFNELPFLAHSFFDLAGRYPSVSQRQLFTFQRSHFGQVFTCGPEQRFKDLAFGLELSDALPLPGISSRQEAPGT
jgi:hypothetical protein